MILERIRKAISHAFGYDAKSEKDAARAQLTTVKIAEKEIAEGNYDWAAELFEEAGEHEKARECYLRQAEKGIAAGKIGLATEYFEKAGMKDKAKECWLKEAEEYVAKGDYFLAAYCYKNIGRIDKAEGYYLKGADLLIADERYVDALDYYKLANIGSLTGLPKETQEKLLGLVRKGNVKATQGLAKLVKTEEEELIFNEARAGMVL